MEEQEYQVETELSTSKYTYVSGEVILYSMKDIVRMTGWSYGTVSRLFDDDKFPSIDYGRCRLVENHALMEFFCVRREPETNLFRVRLDRDPWKDEIYYDGYYYSRLRDDYIERIASLMKTLKAF